jgi:hypothetical protein
MIVVVGVVVHMVTSKMVGYNYGHGYVTISVNLTYFSDNTITTDCYIPFTQNKTGDNIIYTDTNIKYNPSTDRLTVDNINYTSIQQISDMYSKENIKDYIIDNPLDIINNLKLKEYNYKNVNQSKNKMLGYIAQDVEENFNIAVDSDDNFKTINPFYFTLLNNEALKCIIKNNKLSK